MTNRFRVEVWGHRGMGCTDSTFAQERNQRDAGNLGAQGLLAENTMPAFAAALKNGLCRAIETDVVLTHDGIPILTHSNDPHQHVLTPEQKLLIGDKLFHQMDLPEIRRLKVGPRGQDFIPTLADLLTFGASNPNTRSGVWLNLELKGSQGTDAPSNRRPLCHAVADTLRAHGGNFRQVRFSSFSASTLGYMAGQCHDAEFGQLFDLSPDMGGTVGRKIFKDTAEVYRPFDQKNLDEVQTMLHGKLTAVHPEVRSLNPAMMEHCAKQGLTVATWAWREDSPTLDAGFKQAAQKAIVLARHYDVPLALITDYPREMNALIKETLEPKRPTPSPRPA